MTRTPIRAMTVGLALVAGIAALGGDDTSITLSDCPVAVKKAFEHEAKGAPIVEVGKFVEDGVTTYGAGVVLGGRKYRMHVDANGSLIEMGLEVGEEEVAFDKCPAAVRATFRQEAKDAKFDSVARDFKYGVPTYEAVATIGGKEYSLLVAENGTLVEKMLVIAEDEIELSHCPTAVQLALKEHAQGGKIGPITRASGIGGHVFEAELAIKGKAYFVEVTEGGGLITKTRVDVNEEDNEDKDKAPARP